MDIVLRHAGSLAVLLILGASVAAFAQDSSSTPNRPIEKDLQAVSENVRKQAPDAARVIDDGIRQIAASGIVEKAPKVGDTVRPFALPDASGKTVKLTDLLAKGPVVLTWYRGGWCPYCNIALRGLLDAEPSIREQGATLVAVTPELPDWTADTVKKDGLTFVVLSDRGNTVAKQYNIVYRVPENLSAVMKAFKIDLAQRNGDGSDELPLGVTFVIDSKGVVRWAFVNADYRKRAEPADIVGALKALKN